MSKCPTCNATLSAHEIATGNGTCFASRSLARKQAALRAIDDSLPAVWVRAVGPSMFEVERTREMTGCLRRSELPELPQPGEYITTAAVLGLGRAGVVVFARNPVQVTGAGK